MARVIGIGYQDFAELIGSGCFYVDKTGFIKEWWENMDVVTLITRPRRFGKTLNMNMLERFFSVEYEGQGQIFEGLSIWNEKTYRTLQGTWPVIALSFADIKETSFPDAKRKICQVIRLTCGRFSYLLESPSLTRQEKESFRDMYLRIDQGDISLSLKILSLCLSRHYGRNVILLLDEYDTPLQEAYIHGYWNELAAFIRSLFNSSFKTNPYLARAVMTGITRISRESIFSDLNHLEVVTTTSEKYETSFGFTQQEVWNALEEYDLGEKRQEVKDWYDGFVFGKKRDIYNPWSILNYLDKRILATYWANTSSNSLIGKLLREGSPDVKESMEDLLNGQNLCAQIDEQIVFDQLDEKEDAIWSLFVAGGYLKVNRYRTDEQTGRKEYELQLTNKEVRIMFENMIADWFGRSKREYNGFIKALLLGDRKAMNAYMNRVALATFSYFDSGNRPSGSEPERFYHGFVLGLMTELSDRYVITSNRESGFGRYDVMLKPRNARDDALLLEFKVHDPEEEASLKDTAKAALEQIHSRNYKAALTAEGISEARIRSYGFAFEGKQVLIL